MSLRSCICLAAAGVCGAAAGQAPAESLKFEVASVKAADPNSGPGGGRVPQLQEMIRNSRPVGMIPTVDAGRVRIQGWTLLDLISAAYSLRPNQVTGPSWLSEQSWDIEARIPEGAPKERIHEMLQALLEERFGLKIHRESRTESGYALVVGKNGPKLQEASTAPDPLEGLSPEDRKAKMQEQVQAALKRMMEARKNGEARPGMSRSSWRAITTEQLASHLAPLAQRPVIDTTGLTGKYDVTVETWGDSADEPGQTVFVAVEKLGLKLEPRKVTLDTLVVDQCAKTPTAN